MTRTVVLTLLALAGPAVAQQAAESYDRDFGLLEQQNMFLRDRPSPRPAARRSRTPSVNYGDPEVQERIIVLRGVVIEDAELHAYVENTHTGEVFRLSPGDVVARGRVSDIAIDAIAYDYNGKQSWVDVGENLAGGQSDERPATQPTTVPAIESRPGAPVPLPPGGGTLEERLKARRQQLQKK